jgi:hypothetical protein
MHDRGERERERANYVLSVVASCLVCSWQRGPWLIALSVWACVCVLYVEPRLALGSKQLALRGAVSVGRSRSSVSWVRGKKETVWRSGLSCDGCPVPFLKAV